MTAAESRGSSIDHLMVEISFWTKNLWIFGVGLAIAAGYIMNFVVSPIWGFKLVEFEQLNEVLFWMVVITGTRDVLIIGFKKIGGEIFITNSPYSEGKQDFRKAVKRYWIPIVGWALAGGYICNCLVWPLGGIDTPVDWNSLRYVLMVLMITLGGRDVTITGIKLFGGKISIQTPKENDCRDTKKE